jgi:hypothetical protein
MSTLCFVKCALNLQMLQIKVFGINEVMYQFLILLVVLEKMCLSLFEITYCTNRNQVFISRNISMRNPSTKFHSIRT